MIGQASLTWDDIEAAINALPSDHFDVEVAYKTMQIAGILGVFGDPQGSTYREEKHVSEETREQKAQQMRDRETRFAGFAKDLLDALGQVGAYDTTLRNAIMQKLIASHAYDLACHVVNHISVADAEFREGGLQTAQDIVEDIPDLVEKSEEKKQVSEGNVCPRCKGLRGFNRSDLPRLSEMGVIEDTGYGPVFRVRDGVSFRFCFGHPEASNPRDTQFSGFAKAIFDDIAPMFSNLTLELADRNYYARAKETETDIKAYIAQRAYDLVKHTIASLDIANLDRLTNVECVERTPDLTNLPEVAE